MIDFNELISNFLKKELKAKTMGRYYPSEAGSCIRKVWFSYKKPKELDMDTIKVFEVGNMLHAFMSEVIRSEKNPHVELVEEETAFEFKNDGMIISGRPDEIVLLKINGRTYIVEVKSTKNIKYASPSENHIMQLQLYMYAKNIKNGLLLYVEKNTLQSKAFEIEYDEKEVENAIERFKIIHEHLTKNKIPGAEAKLKGENWMCDYCNYREECDAEEE